MDYTIIRAAEAERFLLEHEDEYEIPISRIKESPPHIAIPLASYLLYRFFQLEDSKQSDNKYALARDLDKIIMNLLDSHELEHGPIDEARLFYLLWQYLTLRTWYYYGEFEDETQDQNLDRLYTLLNENLHTLKNIHKFRTLMQETEYPDMCMTDDNLTPIQQRWRATYENIIN